MTRTKRIYCWLTDKEFECLMQNVKKSGLRREPYLRSLIDGYEVKEAPTEEWAKLIRMLSGMANNLNQLTWLSHRSGEVADWEAIRQMQQEVSEIFSWVQNG